MLKQWFEKYEDEYLKFEDVKDKRSLRPDLHAFIILSELVVSDRDIVSASGYEEIWLDVDIEALSEVITEEIAIDLIRCGVRLDTDREWLCMFV